MRNALGWRTLGRTCLAAAGFVGLCVTVPHPAAASDEARTIQQLTQALASVRNLSKQMPPYDAVFHRDPMRPLVNSTGDLVTSPGLHGGLSIQGIIWSDQHPLAVVDDELVAQGDVLGPYTVTEIKPDGLVATAGGETVVVPLDRGIAPRAAEAPSSNALPAADPASP